MSNEAQQLRREIRTVKEELSKRLDNHEKRLTTVTTTVEDLVDDGTLSGGGSQKKPQRGNSGKAKAQAMWERASGGTSGGAKGGTSVDVDIATTPVKPKSTGKARTDNMFKGPPARPWAAWAGTDEGYGGHQGGAWEKAVAKKSPAAKSCGAKGSSTMGAQPSPPAQATPKKYGSFSRPNVRPIGPLQFMDNTPAAPTKASAKAKDHTTSGEGNSGNSRKRMPYGEFTLYGNPPPRALMPTPGMQYYNSNAPQTTFPLYDKEPVLVGNFGLRAYRMSAGGCIATFEVDVRSDGTPGLLPINGQLVHNEVQHRLRYLERHSVSTKGIKVPESDKEWHMLRVSKVVRDVLLMHLVETLGGTTNDRPLFLTKPVGDVNDDRAADVRVNDAPEPVRTILTLITGAVRMEHMDQDDQQKVVTDALQVARTMLGPLRNGFPELEFSDPQRAKKQKLSGRDSSSDEY